MPVPIFVPLGHNRGWRPLDVPGTVHPSRVCLVGFFGGKVGPMQRERLATLDL